MTAENSEKRKTKVDRLFVGLLVVILAHLCCLPWISELAKKIPTGH
jgi:hypothetical protein